VSTPLSPETLAWLHQAAAAGFAEPMALQHVMQRLDALEVTGQLDAEAWASMRRASCDFQRRLQNLEAAQQQPASHAPAATEIVPDPEDAPVVTEQGLVRCYAEAVEGTLKADQGIESAAAAGLRAVYNFGRQHGATQPPAANPAPEGAPPAAPVGGLLERVAAQMTGDDDPSIDARAAIREVAVWLDLEGYVRAANDLREEVVE